MKYDSDGGDNCDFPMFLIDTFCCSRNDCGDYNNEFRSKYSL